MSKWNRLPQLVLNMLARSAFTLGAVVPAELMEILMQPPTGTTDASRPLSRSERRKWVALVEQLTKSANPRP